MGLVGVDTLLMTLVFDGWLLFLYAAFRVNDQLRVKLCDTALSRDLHPSDYHCLGDNENRPIKWMALESIARKEYSSASDVVSRIYTHFSSFCCHCEGGGALNNQTVAFCCRGKEK